VGKKIKDDQVELANVFHKDAAGEISGLATEKATPVAGDWIFINDSADANNIKKVQVGNLPGGGGTGADSNEEAFTTDGGETPGTTVTFGPLSATPRGGSTAATPSGYDIAVFRNGIRMKYSATPSTYMHFYYDSANNEVDVLAPGSADEYSVVYGS